MSEKEKGAVVLLTELRGLYEATAEEYRYRGTLNIPVDEDDSNAIELILNLIKKQQNKIANQEKEIKLMKSVNINDNYVSKDEIREKIKDLKKEQEEYKDSQEWEIQDDIVAQIEVLEELLGE